MEEGHGDDSAPGRAAPPADSIVCVDCGGTAYLLTAARESGEWYLGESVAYRCRDCRDRWDLVLEDAPEDPHDRV